MFALRAARLFDGDSLRRDATVLVADGRIVAVDGPVPESVVVNELGDVTLLPGLIDAHQHLAFDARPDQIGRLARLDDEELLADMRRAARTALGAGITTVRDLGDRGYLALRVEGPTVLASGPPITTRGGHCWFLGGEVEGVEVVRASVRAHAQRGVHVIKVMASGGELTPGTHSHLSQFGRAELNAVVDEAHELGLPVAAHAHAPEAIENVLAAGVDSIEHCSFMTEEGTADRPDLIDAIAAAGVTVTLTAGVTPGAAPPPRIAARLAGFGRIFAQLRAAGVPLVCASDAGIGPPKPHDVLPHSVAMMVSLVGCSPVEALRAATSVAARSCRVEDRKGRLAAGYDADILAVGGDPLADPADLLNVRAVYANGVEVSA
ncbi:amidohydrolase family protein [Actinomadura barringtoniae]|uniref:Amidohydrolase family protein n=1 Tax=Actinomadura barringtoniae TaxID=1427535 RepID=A0A939T6D4_9ACTN|nr:amidohydrolase family protein [Actinomadura barringtoniae]MBO2450699.1 amidohydrolase family protein [Actinomadura barringtoniae]